MYYSLKTAHGVSPDVTKIMVTCHKVYLSQLNLEKVVYLFIWSSSVFYSFYCFAQESQGGYHCLKIRASWVNHLLMSAVIKDFLDPTDFRKSWFGKSKDVSDLEWAVLTSFSQKYLWNILAHILLSQVINRWAPKIRPFFYWMSGAVIVTQVLNFRVTAFLHFHVILTICLNYLGQKWPHYLTFITIFSIVHQKDDMRLLETSDRHKMFLFQVCAGWISAKALSFSIDRIKSGHHKNMRVDDVIQILSYCFYLPPLFTGPIHCYKSFSHDIQKDPPQKSFGDYLLHSVQMLRFLFWSFVLEVIHHYVYSSATLFYPDLAERFDGWTLCGLGYSLTCLFYLKYFIIFGLSGVLSGMDGIHVPPPPKCVTRIHLSTQIWRYFDRGLYIWLQEYFYRPIIGSSKSIMWKIIAAAMSFTCVALWHGVEDAVVTWCTINFFTVCLEKVGVELRKRIVSKYKISESNELRIRAAGAAPFFALMIISNIYFLSNFDLGQLFMRRIFLSSFPVPLIPTLIVMYAGSHVSLMTKDYPHVDYHQHLDWNVIKTWTSCTSIKRSFILFLVQNVVWDRILGSLGKKAHQTLTWNQFFCYIRLKDDGSNGHNDCNDIIDMIIDGSDHNYSKEY